MFGRFGHVGVLVAGILMLAGCGTQQAPGATNGAATQPAESQETGSPPAELVTLRVGSMPFQDYFSIWVAKEKGWFEEEGIDVQITTLPWYDAVNTALASDSIDIGSSTPDSRLAVYQTYDGAKQVFLAFSFEGFGLIVRPDEFDTYEELLEANGGDKDAALRDAMAQLEGKTILYATTGGSSTFVETALSAGGLTLDDVTSIDLNVDQALTAFMRGEGDAFLGGLPQRTAALDAGNAILVTAADLPPEAAELVGWAARTDYAEEHPEAILGFMRGWYRTMQLIEESPDEGLQIIADKVNEVSNTGLTVEALKGLWNVIEFFPASAQEAEEFFYDPDGDRYWRRAYDAVMTSYIKQGLYEEPVDPSEVMDVERFHEMYLDRYGE